MHLAGVAAGFVLAAVPAIVLADEWQVPRTEWGDPDLTGNWPIDYLAQTPRVRPAHMGTRAELTDEEYEAALRNARSALRATCRASPTRTRGGPTTTPGTSA